MQITRWSARCWRFLLGVGFMVPAASRLEAQQRPTVSFGSPSGAMVLDSALADTRSAPGADWLALVPTGQSGIQEGDSTAPGPMSATALGDSATRRPHAIEYGSGYAVRLKIHQIASYAELPLFAGEYVLGQKLLHDERTMPRAPRGLRHAHRAVALGLEGLFLTNTVTGVWNLLESRHDPNGRTRRTIHAVGMLLADAGFAWTSSLAHGARRSDAGAVRHRNVAIASISLATASTLMMWLWKN